MIREVAIISIKPGMGEQFERSFSQAIPLFKRARGCKSVQLERSVEDPLRHLVLIGWETLEDHIVEFRNSYDYHKWRELVGGLFAAPPSVDHTEIVIANFKTE
jgi:heme-degrading monooxygenase HmoA